MTTDINMEQLKRDAEEIFCNGFACSESVIYTLRNHFQIEFSDDAIAMSSGFPWGLGGGGCLCGAVAGGTMILGYFFGRTVPGDPKNVKCFALTEEFHNAFKKEFGATCCRVLTKGMERDSKERKDHCIKMVKFTVEKIAEIVKRELETNMNS